MSVKITIVSMPPLPRLLTWIGTCRCPAREWIMAWQRGGRCPHCGTGINFLRIDDWGQGS